MSRFVTLVSTFAPSKRIVVTRSGRCRRADSLGRTPTRVPSGAPQLACDHRGSPDLKSTGDSELPSLSTSKETARDLATREGDQALRCRYTARTSPREAGSPDARIDAALSRAPSPYREPHTHHWLPPDHPRGMIRAAQIPCNLVLPLAVNCPWSGPAGPLHGLTAGGP
jgi:hypothetical protein